MAAWSTIAAFGTYGCMYAFRKPFTVGSYATPGEPPDFKATLVMAQVLGYAVSKLLGIRVTSSVSPGDRAFLLIALVVGAEVALVAFALSPPGVQLYCLFVNGLALGMVFGLVLGFLEGRRLTEAFVAGLCASFILADGAAKSVGAFLLTLGVAERWMPAAAGALFLPPLLGFVLMLRGIPPPTSEDLAERSERPSMNRSDRSRLLRHRAPILTLLIGAYVVVTVLRSFRADFAPELWRHFGITAAPATFTLSEIVVALLVTVATGLTALVRENARAFRLALLLCLAGTAVAAVTLVTARHHLLDGWSFMILTGLGLYLPYVAIHTTVLERLIAVGRDRGNLAFLMSVADAAGYLGYVLVMMLRRLFVLHEPGLATAFGLGGILVTLCLLAFAGAFSLAPNITRSHP